ncbi:Eco57I restriction endonuclease [Belliella baltica DSM 15883]|uniref:site-specific DNA-methyltransferase (adenine-specific) n=1 Tax=Belliella baltica (strain DSM 15883 / CIP 108006 / LMG 21964 / BA134) TaxID=866536 RepID=I3Z1N2_BELBD|nr:TaqI-like C-terminal specificity domain-containing protein [Belliella baltica]AFL83150.1 Eco57I restriction endonuclease [Belliella baltica DSM 15883]
MNHKFLKPRQALNKAFLKVKPVRTQIEVFKGNLIRLFDQINESESEEFHKNLVSDFLKRTYYEPDFSINTKGRNDMVIHNGKDAKSPVGVILETKKPTNKSEMISFLKARPQSSQADITLTPRPSLGDKTLTPQPPLPEGEGEKPPISASTSGMRVNLNVKSFQELILYFLRERITQNNLEVKHLVVTNIYEWFVFDASVFEKAFAQNKTLVKDFKAFEEGRLSGNTTDFFYKEIASREINNLEGELPFTYFDLRNYDKPLRNADKKDDVKLIALFKLLSPEHMLKLPFSNDSNNLDKRFYSELLHIIGLTETKEGGKKLIGRNKEGERNTGSILEDAIIQLDSLDKISRLSQPSQFGKTHQERLFNVALELSITWINRILFLKLLEAQLFTYHKGDKSYSFLSLDKIKNYDDLNSLFFQVLARKFEDRNPDVKALFEKVPYLNSSLFEPTDIEHSTLFISNLRDDKLIPIISSTVLKNEQGKKRTGKLSTLEYLFEFLNAYDFSSEGSEDIQEDNKTLINASVLGLIFEKINGYKDGSFFTPGFITMYMCRETIRRAVVQKFKESGFKISEDLELSESLDQIYDQIEDRKQANEIVNSIKICDPAVGSGHFLVSALNEMIAVKNDLKILQDRNGKRLKEYQVEVVNDELIVTDEEGELFEYNPSNKESQRIQETLFHEKQAIIENCLFGVDINPNSVKICRLRLWIELLKNAYYKQDLAGFENLTGLRALETLPNIDINIKCGNSLVSRFAIDADLSEALKKSKFSIDSYRMAVTTYRNAQSKEEKREMERLIAEIKSDFRSEIANNDPKIKRKAKLGGELYNLTMQTGLFEVSAKEKKERKKKVEKIEAELEKLSTEIEEIKSNKIYENAFEWRFEFPEVLNESGDFVGFDVVIGNPPYGALFNESEKEFIKNNYQYSDYQFDIYMTFFELSFHLLKEFSQLCFIVPNTWLLNLKTPNIRKLLFTCFNTYNVRAYSFPVFEEAVVDTIIVSAVKLVDSISSMSVQIIDKNGDKIENHFSNKLLAENYHSHINIYLTDFASKIDFKFSTLLKLDNVAKITQGTKPFQKGKGKPKQDEKTMQEKPFVQSFKKDHTFRPLLRGSLINKYVITWNDNYYISFGDWLAEPRYSANYDAPIKIVIRQTGSSLISTIDNRQFVVRDNLYTIISTNNEFSEYVLLALLNSNLLNWYYQNIINNEVGEALAQVKRGHLEILPMPNYNETVFKNICNLIQQILELKQADNSADIKELENQIDQLVYELYGLTEEEIRIVEGGEG